MNKINGCFVKIIFSNPKSNYHVLSFKIEPNQELQKEKLNINKNSQYITVIVDEEFELHVCYEVELELKNSKYGQSFYLKNKDIVFNNSNKNAINFLASKMFPGVGFVKAQKIIDKIGLEIFDDPLKYKDVLLELIGDKATIVIDGIINQTEYQKVFKIFIKENLPINILNSINSFVVQNKIKDFLENNIFDFIDFHDEINYFDLVKIAKIFYKKYSLEICDQYLILYCIYQLEKSEGSTLIDVNYLFKKIKDYRPINQDDYKKYLKNLFNENKIIVNQDKKFICSAKIYYQEKFIIDYLWKLSNQKNDDFDKIVTKNLDSIQIEALKNSLKKSFTIITGSPGTGKTLLIDLILENLKLMNYKKIEILTPTGKAATQISQRTKMNARTIHSFLKINKTTNIINVPPIINVDILIIDEFSMVNTSLFYTLLSVVPNLKKLIIIGDKNQLPSIGAGYLLNDFIDSDVFNVNLLTKIYRQKEGSSIIKNALLINESKMPILNDDDTKMFEIESNEQAYSVANELIIEYLEKYDDLNKLQILIPMYNGLVGIDNINLMVQSLINVNKTALFSSQNKNYYKNDKVIQLENDYDQNVFNGEIGFIKNVEFKNEKIKEIEIDFESKIVKYSLSEFNKFIKLAYAVSIHKFQGSQCDHVIFIVAKEHHHMLSKKLIYTAYTRAMKKIDLIVNIDSFQKGINDDGDSNRITNIQHFINQKK